MPKKNEPEIMPKPYVQSGDIEAHIIADMLRIESITAELKEFKEVINHMKVYYNCDPVFFIY